MVLVLRVVPTPASMSRIASQTLCVIRFWYFGSRDSVMFSSWFFEHLVKGLFVFPFYCHSVFAFQLFIMSPLFHFL